MTKIKIQKMDITSLKAVLSDLRPKIIPSRFEKPQQIDSNTLQIGFKTLNDLIWIEASWQADSSRIVEIDAPEKTAGISTLAKQIKYGLQRMALVDIKQTGYERIVEFHFALRPNESFQKILLLFL